MDEITDEATEVVVDFTDPETGEQAARAGIVEGAAVTVSGFTDPETDEPVDRGGRIVSGGHRVDGAEYYEVQLADDSFASLIEASRVTVAD